MSVLRALCVLVFGLALLPALAAEGDAARATIQKTAPLQSISAFRQSALPGYYEGVIGGKVVYASADGKQKFAEDFAAAWAKVMELDRFDLR